MRTVSGFVAALMMGLSSVAWAQSSQPIEMAPVSHWAVDYAEDSCALRRSFAANGNQMVLELREFGPGPWFEVTAASSTISRTSSSLRSRFEPDSETFAPRDAVFLSGGSLRAVRFTDSVRPAASKGASGSLPEWPESERDARERAITGLTLTGIAPEAVTLKTGSLTEPMAALRNCLDDLLKQAGLDPEVQRSLSKQAKAIDQIGWARRTQEGLPSEIVRAGGSGRAHVRLIVGSDGRPTTCIALRTSGAPGFGKYACDTALRYARFEPALDAQNRPVETAFFSTVAYEVR